jgi:hypothetical protein
MESVCESLRTPRTLPSALKACLACVHVYAMIADQYDAGAHSLVNTAALVLLLKTANERRDGRQRYTCHNSLLLESIAVKLEESTAFSGSRPFRFAPLPRPLSSSRAAPEAASAVVLSAVPPYCALTVELLQLDGCSSKLAVTVADTSRS